MEVITTSGKTFTLKILFAKGHPRNPMTDAEFEAKFRSCVKFAIKDAPAKKVDTLIDMLKNIEQLDDISQLTKQFSLIQAK